MEVFALPAATHRALSLQTRPVTAPQLVPTAAKASVQPQKATGLAAFAAAVGAGYAVSSARQRRFARQKRLGLAATQGDEIKFAPASGDDDDEEAPALSLQLRAQGLAESLPALARLSGSIVVIKYGGAAMVKSPERTIRDVALLKALGLKPVLVHGGGPEINSWLAKVGIEPKFVRGLRVTDAATMEVVAMVLMGKVNKGIVATMGAAGVQAVGLGGVDGGLLQAKKTDDEELGFVGEVTGVKPDALLAALDAGMVPVVATVAADAEGNFLNVNADIAAAAIAGALDAEEFVLMTDVPGLLRDVKDPSSLISEVDETGAQRLIEEGIVAGGMIPKVTCCLSAIKDGVQATHIIDGRRPHALLEELFSSEGSDKQGTTICCNK
eukprot:gb/GFBE01038072.1/.p1 GENE.gb/GFBE01038072.1/~~gb/GFBE01038072.1/.p1  ORF type:complete len:383 (+),score=80.29 gb/GFBE01038072.1/:1-1149(+)